MAKKVGSKYFLKDHKLEFSLLPPYKTLAARGGAASAPRQSDQIIAFGQSKYYIDNLRQNIKRGLRQKVRKGVYPGKAPLGCLNKLDDHTIVKDPEKWRKVKKVLRPTPPENTRLMICVNWRFLWAW